VTLLNPAGQGTVHFDGGNGNITLGGNGSEGDAVLLDRAGKQTVHIDGGSANITLGGEGHNGDIRLLNSAGKVIVHIDGRTGDIAVEGALLQPADFVFAANYNLATLDEVDTFIRKNGHLPGIQSGEQIKNNGINLAGFAMNLLQKLEELTLHLINQDNIIREQQKRIEQLENRHS
ncbi:MAG: hypothetical protein RMY36_033520, partial [Nostoc sp. SerVER01]